MSELHVSIFMLIFLTIAIGVVVYKYAGFNKYNIAILTILFIFWIANNLIKTSSTLSGTWQLPVIISAYSFVQVLVRLPLGIWSQKIRSRKVPVITMTVIMTIFAIPMFIEFNFPSILFASIGAGAFAATFGMQNQYWSENWNIRNVFGTIGILLIVTYAAKYTSSIISLSVDVNEETIRYILISSISLSVITGFLYFMHKENVETIHLDNMDSVSKEITPLKLKHVLIMSFKVSTVAVALFMIKSPILVQVTDWALFNSLITASALIGTLIISFILIKFINTRYILATGLMLALLGLVMLLITSFGTFNQGVAISGMVFLVIGSFTYITTMMANVLHFDHKNTLLVLGIWLTVKSLAMGISQVTLGELSYFEPESVKWLLVPAIVLIISNILYSGLLKDGTEVIYDMVDKVEHNPDLRTL